MNVGWWLLVVVMFAPSAAVLIYSEYDRRVLGPRRLREWEQENERRHALGMPRDPCRPTRL